MRSTVTKKLSLAVERIRDLNGGQLGSVRGGSRWQPCTHSQGCNTFGTHGG